MRAKNNYDECVMINTQGLDEGIICAMCTNSMKSDRGCDGSCVVNNAMYKAVMDVIENHIVSGPATTVNLEKTNCDTCVYSKETDGSNCYECIKGIKNSYKPATEDNVIVDKFDKAINQSDLEEWIMETFPDWCEGDVRLILNHMDKMHPVVCPYCEKLIGV